MDTRSCAHHTCDQEFTTKYPTKKYCSERCGENAQKHRARKRNPEKFRQKDKDVYQRRRDAYLENDRRYYREVTKPRGVRMGERLAEMFHRLGTEDPSRLPEFANKVLAWRPKGYMASLGVALHPYGELEGNWLYYAEMSPEEAVVVYARED